VGPLPVASAKRDVDKSKEELIEELKALRDVNNRTGNVESEEKFRVLAEVPSAIFWIYQGEHFVYVNSAGERLTGYSVDELLQMRFWDIVHPDDRCFVRERGMARQRGDPVPNKYEVRVITKTGETRWVELTAGRIMYNGEPAGIAMFFDITECKRAEELLGRSENLYKTLAEAAQDLIFIIGRDDKVLYTNNYAANAFGKRPEDIIGMLRDDLFPRKISERQKGHLSTVFESGKPTVDEDIFLYGNREIWINTQLVPIWSDGRVEAVMGISRDITERKRTEEALRESEEKFRMLADSANVGILLVQDEDIIYINQALAAMAGYTVEECRHLKYWDVMPQDMKEYIRWAGNARQQGWVGPSRSELKIIRKDSREVWLDCSWAVPAFGGRPAVIVICADITERKKSEKALEESRLELAKAQGITHIGSYTRDLVTGELSWSNEIYRILGIDPSSKPDFNLFISLIVPEDKHRVLAAIQNSERSGEPYNVEYTIRSADGTMRFIKSIVEIEKDASGLVFKIVGTCQDVTDQKRVEEALRENEEKFRALADTSFGMIAVHSNSNLLYVNDQAEKLTGYSKDELLKMQFWEIFTEDTRELIKSRAFDRLAGKPEPTNYETKISTKDGQTKWVNLTSGLFLFEDKPAIIATLFDVTESKNTEKELTAAKAQAELYLDLMGHDINNMHQIALGYLELASDMPSGEEQNGFINKSVEVLQRSAQLIGNVRKLQKLREGTFQTQDIDVIPLLRDLQRECGGVPKKRVILNFNGLEHCFVSANELLHDVYANLITNAIKHTGDKSDIVIDVDVIKNNDDRYCRVMVEDNGPGIPVEKKATIFNRTLAGTNKAKGMGLGLYLVKSLVDSYGGQVWVEDRVLGNYKKGAKFIVMLRAIE
jgi:PAS domain S-box-containing protein